jgi:ribosomal protein S18 acetylase RimI-like enzyme
MKENGIRRAALPDIPYLYEICLKTGDAGRDASPLFNDPFVVGQYFAAPYLLYLDGVCFVADYECRPQGYIVGVPDTAGFNRWMEECWLPLLRARYSQPFPPELIRSDNERGVLEAFHKRHFPPGNTPDWYADYPAHLHIDILPGLQGKGMGRMLMNNFCSELAGLKIPGVHLGVNIKNTNAIAFYQKTGFSVLQTEEWGLVMGKRCAEI